MSAKRSGDGHAILIAWVTAAVLCGCAQAQRDPAQAERAITRNLEADLESLFPSDTIEVEIMDQIMMSPRRQELMAKFTAAVQKDREWFLAQQARLDSGQVVQYDPRIGLTESEYAEVQRLTESMEDMKAASSGSERVEVLRSGGVFRFRSQGRLEFLNTVVVDGRNNIASVAGHQLTALDTVCVTSEDNVFKSPWRGYKWQFSEPEYPVMPKTESEIAEFSLTLYTITIGLFDKSGKTLLQIKGSETHLGQSTVKFEYPLVF